MPRTHQEVREAAREEAFAEARRIEKRNYKRSLVTRIGRRIGNAATDFIMEETGSEPRIDYQLTQGGDALIVVWNPTGRKVNFKIRIDTEVEDL